ncbi:hypothetical protein V3W47_18350 [Deinococcus sp. YIM 134068]|uniref:hypothetical protein n=1 Tax=Deinococcus lichenicola TaxID=3118910 RepID=UPI002F92969B
MGCRKSFSHNPPPYGQVFPGNASLSWGCGATTPLLWPITLNWPPTPDWPV